MDDAMTLGELGSLLIVEILLDAYGALDLTREQARERLLTGMHQDPAAAAWFDMRWPTPKQGDE